MAVTIAELEVKITSELNKVKKDLSGFRKGLDKSSNLAEKSSGRMSRAFKTVGVAVAAIGITKLLKSIVELSSEAEETANKFKVVFSTIKDEADAAAKNLQTNFGLSSQAAQQLLGDTGDLLTGFGLTQEEALKLSDAAARLGTDLASFTNYSGGAQGATQALAAAMLGERERVKSLGIALTETDLKKFAADQGKAWDQMDRGQRATLTLDLAMQQSKNAIGDFSRSMNEFANVQRRVEARLKDVGASAGKELTPALANLGIAFLELTKDGGVLQTTLNGIVDGLAWIINSIAKAGFAFEKFNSQWHENTIDDVLEKLNKQILQHQFYIKRMETEAKGFDLTYNKTYQNALKNLEKLRAKEAEVLKDKEAEVNKRNELEKLSEEIFNRTQSNISRVHAQEQQERLKSQQAFSFKYIEAQKTGLDALNDLEREDLARLEELTTISDEEREEKRTEIAKYYADQRKNYQLTKVRESIQSALQLTSQMLGQLGGLFNQYTTNRNISLDNDRLREQTRIDESYTSQKEQIENNIKDENEKAAALKVLDEKQAREEDELNKKIDKRRRKLARDAAKKQKKLAIAETLIAIPQAAFAAFKAMAGIYAVGPILGGIAAAAATALGFAKLALIKQQPLPAAQFGGVFEQPYIGGEAGREMAVPLESDQGRNAIRELAAGMLDVMSQQADTRATIEPTTATTEGSGGNVYLDGTLVGRWISKASNNGIFTLNSRVLI